MPLIPATPYQTEPSGRRYPSQLQRLVDKHAALIGRGFGLTDRQFNHLGHASLGDVIDPVALAAIVNRRVPAAAIERLESLDISSATEPVRVPPTPELEMTGRICVPVRVQAILLGYLWLIDEPPEPPEPPEPLDPVTMAAAGRAASEIGAELYRLRYLERQAYEQETDFLRTLASGRDVDADVLGQIEHRLTRAGWYVAVVVDCPEDPEDAGRAETEIGAAEGQLRRTRGAGDILAAVVDGRGLIVIALANPSDAEHQGDTVLAATQRTLDQRELSLAVGVGAPVRTMEGLRSSFAQAEQCVRVAKQRGPGSHCVSWASLGADRAIFALLGKRDPMQFVPDSVLGLLETTDSGAELIDTLWRYLELAGDAQATAQAIFVHRSTLYHRLHRIEEITGRDLRRGDDRLELHLGLRLSRLIPPPDGSSL